MIGRNSCQNSFVEAFNYIKQMDSIRENKIQQQLTESIERHKNEIDRIQNIRESREMKIRNHSKLLEDCKNDALATVLKAIYIEALVPSALTDNGIILAESLVDSWIKQKGGASRVIAENRNKTYLLNRLCNIAEKAAFLEAEEIENIEKEEESKDTESKGNSEEDKKAKVSELMAQAQELIAKAEAIQNGEDVDDESSEDTEEVSADDLSSDETESEGEDNTSEEGESKEEESDDDDDDFDDDLPEDEEDDGLEDDDDEEDESEESDESGEEDNISDGEESDEEDDFDDDLPEDEEDDGLEDGEDADIEDDGNVDGSDITGEDMDDTDPVSVNDSDDDKEKDTTAKGQIFDELEDEEDVKKAVQIINQRVSDAEEDFIKRNAEDKKKIDDLIGKISDNIKTVEDISNNDDPKSKVAEESVRMYNRQIKSITENRPQKVFEKMVRKLSESAVKDPVLKESYTLESGKLDIGGIIESAKIMYGFLETLNTLQLEKVDKQYIMDMIKEL